MIVGLLPIGLHLCACRFLPAECDSCVRVFDPEVDAEAMRERKADSSKKAESNLLDVAHWQVGWDRQALALAMTDMLEFRIAMQYKQV